MQNLTPEQVKDIAATLSKIGSYEFSVFELDACAGKNTIYFVLNQSFLRFGLLKCINEKKFVSFCKELMEGYNRDVVYHNDLHGADVCQTTLLQIEKGDVCRKLKLGDIDLISVITAAAAHDYKHNGLNNNFQVTRGTDMALTYNDNTVLENWHVSQTFKTLLKQPNNFVELFSPEEYRHFRRRMIDCILNTDMARHVQQRTQMMGLLNQFEIKGGVGIEKLLVSDQAKTFDNQQTVLSQIVHTADLSNPAKIPAVFDKWTELVYSEFFSQGDIEKKLGMPVSSLCDRDTVKIAKSQVGFIQYVVLPQFEMMMELFPELKFYQEGIEENLKRYKIKAEAEDSEKK